MTAERAEASGERSVAAGRSIGMIFTGDGVAPTFVGKASPPLPGEAFELPPCTSPVVHLPEKTRRFVGRERELAALDAAFQDAGGVVVHAVHGLGGIGKSTLAAHWAAARTGTHNPVWWITAETEADLDGGLADLAVALQPALGDVLSRRALRDVAVRWLSANTGWLLVLDNVSAPADVKGLLGRATGGRVLITTRQAAGWQGVAETLSLDVLELPEAVELFGRVYGGPAEDVEELCRELGCLPLAVEQAGAYCREARITPRAYLEQLAAHPEQVLMQTPEGGRTIARIWRMTLERLADTPLAEIILNIIAWWAPDGIHRTFLEPIGSAPEVTEALRRLAAHSMITLHDDDTLSVHRLVQAVTRAGDPERKREARDAAARLLSKRAGYGDIQWDWALHAETLLGHVAPGTEGEDIVQLLCNTAVWLPKRDAGNRARLELAERAVEVAERVSGAKHAVTLSARQFLAGLYEKAGDFDRAHALCRKNLSISIRTFGRKHAQTFRARTRLAHHALARGDFEGAVSLAEKTARQAERALGPDDDETLEVAEALARTWVGLVRSDCDRYALAAVAEVERRRAQAVRAGGETCKIACLISGHLRDLYILAGDLAKALAVSEALVEAATRRYGELNMLTLTARRQHIELLIQNREVERAQQLAQPLLDDWERGMAGSYANWGWAEALTALLPHDPPTQP